MIMMTSTKASASALFVVAMATASNSFAHARIPREDILARSLADADPSLLTPQNVQDFVEFQIDSFYGNCTDFLHTFVGPHSGDHNIMNTAESGGTLPTEFEFCEGGEDCLTTPQQLLEFCGPAPGTRNWLHTELTVFPGARPRNNYGFITFSGKQSACIDIGQDIGFGPVTPLCFDFVVSERLHGNPEAMFGVQASRWEAYYITFFGTCPGFENELLECNDDVSATGGPSSTPSSSPVSSSSGSSSSSSSSD